MAKKRGHNEGSIYKDGNRWIGAISIKRPGEKRRRKKVSGRTRKEVAQKLDNLRRSLDNQPAGVDQTLDQWLRAWLEGKRDALAPRTYHSYDDMLRLHILPDLGATTLRALSRSQIQTSLRGMFSRDLSERTVKYARDILRAALNDAVLDGALDANPASNIPITRRGSKAEKPVLTIEHLHDLLRDVQGTRYELIYITLVTLGLRRGELLGLHWDDVSLTQENVTVRGNVQRIDHQLVRDVPKDGETRTIPLTTMLAERFRAHRETEEGKWYWPVPMVFPSEAGTYIEPRNLSRHFSTTAQRLGLPTTRLHDLRHACATLHIAAGTNLKIVSQILGHAQISTTADMYAHVLDQVSRDATQGIEGILFPAKGESNRSEG